MGTPVGAGWRIGGWQINEHLIHRFFQVSLWFKAVFAALEVLSGVATFFVSHSWLTSLVWRLTQGELQENPHDFVAIFLRHSLESLSVGGQHFAGIYLFAHGAVKLWLIIGLLRERLWYYPAAIAVFGAFIAYQALRFTHTHSPWLIALSLIDIVVIALTWHEWRFLRAERRQINGI